MTYINPQRVVKVEGREITEDLSADIISLSYEDHTSDADMATVAVNNKNNKWGDSPLFDAGNVIEVQLGYGRAVKTVFTGIIARPEMAFPEGGAPTLTVRAYDLSQKLRKRKEEKSRTWENITDSDLVRKIASDHGFKKERMIVDQVKEILPYVAQGSESDWEFLKSRAERLGFELFVETDSLHFHKPKDYLKQPSGTFEYGRNLKSFEARISVAEQVTKVVVRGWDAEKKEPIVAIATSETVIERPLLGQQSASDFVKEDFGEGALILHDKVPASQKEAEEIAKAFFKQKEYELTEAHGTCIGDPELRAKALVEIAGVDARFSGTYYIDRVCHTLDSSGYLCEFDCKRNAVTAAGQVTKKPEALSKFGYGV